MIKDTSLKHVTRKTIHDNLNNLLLYNGWNTAKYYKSDVIV